MLKKLARNLRYRQTDAEQKLWSYLRNRKLHGYKFRRQHPFSGYIIDFICIEQKLAIELDGGMHIIRTTKDSSKTQHLQHMGFKVLRHKNEEILTRMNEVLADIAKHLEERAPHSSLSP